jgi:hypothetical protein
VKKARSKEDIENFWRAIYGEKVWRNEEVNWIKYQSQQNPRMAWSPISETEVTMALRAMGKWKVP